MADKQSEHEGERIAKVMARAGLCSRREAEAWIAAGRVSVNGAVIRSPALNVGPRDKVAVDGNALGERERTRLFLYHKTAGVVTTHADPQGRPTIFERLPKNLPRLISVGRLDINTEGLLLLTNDGGLARVLELPSTGWLRRYRVRAFGEVTQPELDKLRAGVTVDGVKYGHIEATLDRTKGSNVWLTFSIREGKNREVRNVLQHLGLRVNRLIRVSFGPFQLNELGEGEVEEVKTRTLREQLGERIAADAGVDFDSAAMQRRTTEPLAAAARTGAKPAPKPRPGVKPMPKPRRGETDPKRDSPPARKNRPDATKPRRGGSEPKSETPQRSKKREGPPKPRRPDGALRSRSRGPDRGPRRSRP